MNALSFLFLRPPVRSAGLTAIALVLAVSTQARAETPENSGAIAIPTVTVEGKKDEVPIGQQPDAEGITDYRVTRSTTGAKSDIPNADIPQSVVVIPQKIMEEQNSETLNDVFRNVAGAQAKESAVQGAQWPMIRGFQARSFYKDGLRDDTFDRTYWLGNVERIEVLKGPASVLYGSGDPSGVINIVSKKPLPETSATGSLWGGNYDTMGASGDASVKVTENGSVLARVIADISHKDTFIDNFESDAKHFSALVQARLTDRTALTLGGEYRDRDIGQDSGGQPAYARSLGLPRSFNFHPDWAERSDTGSNLSAKITHEFNDDWKINSGLLLNRYEFSQFLTTFASFNPATNQVTRGLNGNETETDEIISDTSVEGNVSVAGVNNRLLFGTEFSYVDNSRDLYTGILPGGSLTTSIFSPVTSLPRAIWTKGNHQTLLTYRKSVYAQNLVELTPQLKVMLGLRYDDEDRKYKNRTAAGVPVATTYSHDGEWSQRAGATYEIVPGVTVFGGYAHSFISPGTVISLGTLPDADPEMGKQYEGGVKLDLGDALTATASVYQLTRKNVRTTDTTVTPSVVSIVGEQQSNGVELDATWKILPGWNLLLAYAYTDASTTKDKQFIEGAALPNVPLHSGRLWSMYEIQNGSLAGLGFGGGVTYVGKRAVDWNGQFHIPEYATVDLAGYYRINDNVKVSLNVNNLFDTYYYVGGGSSATATSAANSSIYVGEPLTVLGRLQITF